MREVEKRKYQQRHEKDLEPQQGASICVLYMYYPGTSHSGCLSHTQGLKQQSGEVVLETRKKETVIHSHLQELWLLLEQYRLPHVSQLRGSQGKINQTSCFLPFSNPQLVTPIDYNGSYIPRTPFGSDSWVEHRVQHTQWDKEWIWVRDEREWNIPITLVKWNNTHPHDTSGFLYRKDSEIMGHGERLFKGRCIYLYMLFSTFELASQNNVLTDCVYKF